MTIFSGKVDLGQGLRIAIPQMAAEELGIGVERIAMIEGDTALTPDQGATAGSSGIMRGGVQIRQAAATAREALIALAGSAHRQAGRRVSTSSTAKCGRKPAARAIRFADLVGDQRFDAQGRREGAAARSGDVPCRRQAARRGPTSRARSPAAMSTFTTSVVDGMLHGRVVRPPAVGAKLVSVDETSIAVDSRRARGADQGFPRRRRRRRMGCGLARRDS